MEDIVEQLSRLGNLEKRAALMICDLRRECAEKEAKIKDLEEKVRDLGDEIENMASRF